MIIIIIIIIIIVSTLIQGIYNYVPETNNVSSVYSIVAILCLQCMVLVTLFRLLNVLYLCIRLLLLLLLLLYTVRNSIFALRIFTLALSNDCLYITNITEIPLGGPVFQVIRNSSPHIVRTTEGLLYQHFRRMCRFDVFALK
jgi:hypothetical protein